MAKNSSLKDINKSNNHPKNDYPNKKYSKNDKEQTNKKNNDKKHNTENHKDGRLGEASKIFSNVSKTKESILPTVYKAIIVPNKSYIKKVLVNKHLETVEFSSEKFTSKEHKSKFQFKITLQFDRYKGFFIVKEIDGSCFLIASCTNPELSTLRDKKIYTGMRIEQGYAIAVDPVKKVKSNAVMISISLKRDELNDNDKSFVGDYEKVIESTRIDKKRKRIERNTVKVSKKHKKTDFPEFMPADPISKKYSDSNYYIDIVKIVNGTWNGDENRSKALKERIYYDGDDKVVIVFPPISFSLNHLVILPRDESIEGLESLKSEHLPLIRHIEDVTKDLVAHLTSQDEKLSKANPYIHEFRFGVIGLWFQKGCPFQLLSIDFGGDLVLKKTYWNSFMTDILYTTNTIKKALKSEGKVTINTNQLLEKRKEKTFLCPKCGEFEVVKKFQSFFFHYTNCGVDTISLKKITDEDEEDEDEPHDLEKSLKEEAIIPDGEDESSNTRVNIHSKFNPFGR